MLVCNVSLRPPRSAIAAEIAEVAEAVDAAATGFVVFATLVDDPASVRDFVDAYSGEIMVEAASAADVADAAVPAVYAVTIVETMTATDTQNATLGAPSATLDGTATNVTLSNGNRTATHSNTTTDSGARSTAVKTSGKYYFEATFNTTPTNGDCVGIMQNSATFNNPVSAGTNSSNAYGSGICYSNDGAQGFNLSAFTAGQVLSVAADLDNGRIWFRRQGGNWNNTVSFDPATNTGGCILETPGVGYVPFVGFTSGGSGNNVTVNFGASAFAYAVPSGFTSGWPA